MTEMQETLAAAVVARMLKKVEQFNLEVTGLRVPQVPAVLDEQRLSWAHTALQEEIGEFLEATHENDVLEAADALIDLIYFALGRLTEMGIPAEAVFDEVQRANMGKVRGELSKRPGSKGHDAVKPEGWTPPDHQWLLDFELADVAKAHKWDTISPVFKRLHELRESKGADYNDVPGGRDAYFPFGHLSYAHMIHTKELRLQSLLRAMTSGRPVNYEGILDTVEDLVNYATYYAEAMRDGRLSQSSIGVLLDGVAA